MPVADDARTRGFFCFNWVGLLAFFLLLLSGLAIVVVDSILRLVGPGGLADAAVVVDMFLVGLLGEVVLSDGGAELLYVLLAGH
jgi:hypothetical protein